MSIIDLFFKSGIIVALFGRQIYLNIKGQRRLSFVVTVILCGYVIGLLKSTREYLSLLCRRRVL